MQPFSHGVCGPAGRIECFARRDEGALLATCHKSMQFVIAPCIHDAVHGVMQARLTTVEAEETQQKEELNTFYLMWAGTCTTAPPCCARCCATRAHSPNPQLLRASCVRLLLRFVCVVRWLRSGADLPDAGGLCHAQRRLYPGQERQQHPP